MAASKLFKYISINIKENIMTQDRLSVVDIFRIGELFELISKILLHRTNPLLDVQDLIGILKKSELFKEVVGDLEKLVPVLEREKDKINSGGSTFYTENIQRNRGRVEEILKNCFDLRHI